VLYPVIIIGHPRSGTSVVARLLQQSLDVMMNPGFIRHGAINPKGYYEDPELVNINEAMMSRFKDGKVPKNKIDPVWVNQFSNYATHRATTYKKWGFKDPRMIGYISWVPQFFKDPTWIFTVRTDGQILESQVKNLGVTPDDAVKGIAGYHTCIEAVLKGRKHHRVDLREQREENNIVEELKEVLQ